MNTTASRLYTPAQGTHTSLAQLTGLSRAARDLPISAPDRASSPLAGVLTSRFRGRGMDLAEVRAYQPGDDIRSIDWRVTARTGKPHTKLFQEERERPVLMVVDQSPSLFFGSRRVFKSVLAAEAATLLAWAAVNDGDRVGGVVFAGRRHAETRPRRSKHTVLRLIQQLHEFNHLLGNDGPPPQPGYLAEALMKCRRVARHGVSVFVISDFADLDDDAENHLQRLARYNDVVNVQITDLLERELPPPDEYLVTDGQQRLQINTGDATRRTAFRDEFDARLDRVRTLCTRTRSTLVQLRTDEPLPQRLLEQLGGGEWKRMRRRG